jgi:hypothetical protein
MQGGRDFASPFQEKIQAFWKISAIFTQIMATVPGNPGPIVVTSGVNYSRSVYIVNTAVLYISNVVNPIQILPLTRPHGIRHPKPPGP